MSTKRKHAHPVGPKVARTIDPVKSWGFAWRPEIIKCAKRNRDPTVLLPAIAVSRYSMTTRTLRVPEQRAHAHAMRVCIRRGAGNGECRLTSGRDGLSRRERGSAADIHVQPGGHFLCVSNRQGDQSTLALFALDPESGRARLMAHALTRGRTPRNLGSIPKVAF
jgi:hypothetical protein